jgi:hypothetical protein
MRSRRSVVFALPFLIAATLVAEEIPVTDAEYGPAAARTAAVAGSGDSYVTVWTSRDDRLFARPLDREGRPAGKVNLIGFGAENPHVVWTGDRYRVVCTLSDFRIGLFSNVEILDLDQTGRLIDGSRTRLGRIYSPRVASDGDRTFVVGKSRDADYTIAWFLIEQSGIVRSGSIWVGEYFDHGAAYARDDDFGVIWRANSRLYRFELFSGRLQEISGYLGASAATAVGEVAWIVTSSQFGAAVTIMDGPEMRLIKFDSSPIVIRGAYALDGRVVVHATLDGHHRLYRFANDGGILQQYDMPPDTVILALAGGDNSIIAVSSRDARLTAVSLPWGEDGISDPQREDVVSDLAGSKRGPAVASTKERTLVVWREDRAAGAVGERLRGVVLDPSTFVMSEAIVIAESIDRVRFLVEAAGSQFLVWYATAQTEYRVALIGQDGRILSDQPIGMSGAGWVEALTWTGSALLAASSTFESIVVTTWEGVSATSSRVIGKAEDAGEDAWSSVFSSRVVTGRDTILVTWISLVSRCFFPICYEPKQVYGRLLDRHTLEPLSDPFPIGSRDQYEGIETAWNGSHYGIWSKGNGELFRLTETGKPVDDEPIKLRGRSGTSFEPRATIQGLDGSFVVSWLEETWTHWAGVVSRVVYANGSLSPLRAFPLFTDNPSFSTSSSGSELFLAYANSVPDEVFLGAERVFVRTLTDTPLAAPPRAPRLDSVLKVGNNIALEWEDRSDDEIYFQIIASYGYLAGSCTFEVRPPDTTSAIVACDGPGPFDFTVVAWNAAGGSEPSEKLTAIPPDRRRPTRR